ncbi:MAG: DNA-binding MarR family transcriptional regulator [Saprospiraceae bacterium]
MGLEKEIKQKTPFSNEGNRALVNILYSSGWLTERLKSHFKPYGITPKQYNILRILNGAMDPMSTSQIRARMLDKMSDVTRLIDRMVLKQWITKNASNVDRRLIDVRITLKGEKLLKDIDQVNPPLDNIISNLNEIECAQLNILLDKLRG